jgi:hypothetical protein
MNIRSYVVLPIVFGGVLFWLAVSFSTFEVLPMNNAILNVAVGLLSCVVIMLCVVVHRQQQQLADMATFVHVAEVAAMGQIGSNADATFKAVAEKLGR